MDLSYEELIQKEQERQDNNIELIASENYCSDRVREACGSILTNKYAEGYSGKRYYGGCEWIDEIESKAINDVCQLFNCRFANVQPHCGSSANQAVYRALLKPGDTVLGMDLGAGGHLTHGHKMSFSGQDYNIISYGVDENGILDYADLEEKLYKFSPKMVLVGASSYSQIIDYSRIYEIIQSYKIDSYKACDGAPYYFVDMAHVAGLVAAGVHPNPCDWADVVTSTTHKTLRGPRGGIILTNREDLIKEINKAVFPGIQGGPLEHIIAAKGICFEEALQPEFREYGEQVIRNASAFAEEFKRLDYKVISKGTTNHMFVLDTYSSLGLTGKEVEEALDKINVTLNKNQIPNDQLPPMKSSGVRIGTPAMTTKGWKENDFQELASLINGYLINVKNGLDTPETIDVFKTQIARLINNVKERNESNG